MILKKIRKIQHDFVGRGQSLYHLGKEIIREGVKAYNEKNLKAQGSKIPVQRHKGPNTADLSKAEEKSKNLERNLSMPNPEGPREAARQSSLKSHEVLDQDLKEGWNANQMQRNFENHQGN